MSKFRPCIDIHQGVVKQIVGGTLVDGATGPRENHVSPHPPEWFARRFRGDGLRGGHVIKLGPGNDEAAKRALGAWPGGMQVGGGISPENAAAWLDAGASHVIVTSALFEKDGRFLSEMLDAMVRVVGRGRLVIDLSCRRDGDGWRVVMNRWQTPTEMVVDAATLDQLAPCCDEFLIHAADVEGLCGGVDADLLALLGQWGKAPVTYAGGAATTADLDIIASAGNGRVDFTIGSALDLFGGSGFRYDDLVAWNRRAETGIA